MKSRMTYQRRRQSQSAYTQLDSHYKCNWLPYWSSQLLGHPPAYSWSHRGPVHPPVSARTRRGLGTRGKSNPFEVACRATRSAPKKQTPFISQSVRKCWVIEPSERSVQLLRPSHPLTDMRHVWDGTYLGQPCFQTGSDLHRHSHREKNSRR